MTPAIEIKAEQNPLRLMAVLCALMGFASISIDFHLPTMARAMAQHPQQAGAVSAMLGAAQYGSGMAGSGLISLYADGTPRPMAMAIAFGGVAAYACLGLTIKGMRKPRDAG